MSEAKAKRLMQQLEDEGLGNRDRVLAIHHQALAELVGVKTKMTIPKKETRPEPRRATPEGVPSPPSAGENRPGAKDARVAKDSRIDDARNAVGGPEVAKQREAEVRQAIEDDEALAEEHDVAIGADHPDDRGMEGATTDEPESDEDEDEDEEAEEEETEAPRVRKTARSSKAKKAKKAR